MSTPTGTLELVVVLSPNCPWKLRPQHEALPSATAHDWPSPAEIAVTVLPASTPEVFTATGTLESPSATAHEWPYPAVDRW